MLIVTGRQVFGERGGGTDCIHIIVHVGIIQGGTGGIWWVDAAVRHISRLLRHNCICPKKNEPKTKRVILWQ